MYLREKTTDVDLNDFPYTYQVDRIEVVSDHELTDQEASGYAMHECNKYRRKPDIVVVRSFDDEYVDVGTIWKNPRKIERIRRITGYLVGTLDRFNDAKRAEESERVKHM